MIRCEGCNIPFFGPISKACNPHDWWDKIYVLSDFCQHGQQVPIVDDFREAELNGGLPQYMKGRVEIVFLNPYTIKVCALQTSDPFFFSKICRFLGTPHNSTILFFIILNKANTSVPGLHLLDDDYGGALTRPPLTKRVSGVFGFLPSLLRLPLLEPSSFYEALGDLYAVAMNAILERPQIENKMRQK